MKIFAISDLHLDVNGQKPMNIFGDSWSNYVEQIKIDWLQKVSDEDVVLLCGDLSWAMTMPDTEDLWEFLKNLPGYKVILKGNHDYWWSSLTQVRNSLPEKCYAIQNDALKLNNYIFCGSRLWTIPENNQQTEKDEKILNREILRLEMSLKSANKLKTENEQIVCLTHFPPFTCSRENNEVTILMEKYGVNCVVYGHLHGKNVKADLMVQKNGIKYYLTSCDQTNNKLVEILGE